MILKKVEFYIIVHKLANCCIYFQLIFRIIQNYTLIAIDELIFNYTICSAAHVLVNTSVAIKRMQLVSDLKSSPTNCKVKRNCELKNEEDDNCSNHGSAVFRHTDVAMFTCAGI